MSSSETFQPQEPPSSKPDSPKPESRLMLDQLSPEVKSLAINLSKQILAICRKHGIESTLDLTIEANLSQAVADSLQIYIDTLPQNPSLKKDAEHLIWLSKILTEAHEQNKIPETEGIVFIDQSNPQLPERWRLEGVWEIEKHVGEGILELDPSKLGLYYSSNQEGGKNILGDDLKKELETNEIPVLNAPVLDYLFAHPEIIPEEWKTAGNIHFWNTIYRDPHGVLCVRYLYWRNGAWDWYYYWLDNDWHDQGPAAVSASVT